jgi:cytochrome c-type biogenesis protein CcmH
MHAAPYRLRSAWLAALAALVMLCASARTLAESNASAGRRADRASEIEQRLIAPCCWTQTLDVHESELSTELRLEIRDRLARGETPVQIEDQLAARFGERIRAVPPGGDPRSLLPIAVGVGMVLSLFGLLGVVRRGRRRALAALEQLGAREEREDDARYDQALDDALYGAHDPAERVR